MIWKFVTLAYDNIRKYTYLLTYTHLPQIVIWFVIDVVVFLIFGKSRSLFLVSCKISKAYFTWRVLKYKKIFVYVYMGVVR